MVGGTRGKGRAERDQRQADLRMIAQLGEAATPARIENELEGR